ncbi:hypothetical protein P879_01545 [Paragonimus westermani]|uniref:Phosphodiesterase n=2 Tax=Paragonimus westermani TaxID=34504 RepID=A0A8T0DRS8_9TREM|nr:hypothetical protein P879_01545 [Paragonimus westermani]
MGSCTSTGVSRAESPIRSLSTSRSHDCFSQPRRMSPTRRLSSLTPKGFDQKHIQFNQQTGSATHMENSVDLLELGVGNDDIPLRTVGPLITDAHLDNECTNLGVSPNFYKNLATCSLGEYARIPTDTDYFHAAHTPEAMRAAYTRMRQLYEAIEQDRVGKATLLKNLHYTITVMEASYIAERRRIREEEEDLSEAATEYVPNEVRDWLASTFTRTQPIVGIGDQKPRFRSVANAIRAGIFVERIYRRMSSCTNLIIPPNVLMFLKTELDTWSFDVFALNEASENHALKFVGYELFHKYNLINKFQINTNNLECLFIQLEVGYSKYNNPYHNLIHAADVMQTCHMILHMNDLRNWLTDLDVFALLFAAVIHDYEHTGTTNNFHIATSSELALIYNDRGVLENHHVSAIFRLIQDAEFDIFTGLNKDQFKEFRQLVIDMVLCTDMSLHFQQIKNMKSMITMPENVDKTKALSLIVHCADIGHPAKKWPLHEQWTKVLCEEFFRQGDREKDLDLPISPLCDRNTVVVPQSQIGFIDFIVEPCFQVLGDMIERIISPPAVPHGSTPELERKQNGGEKNSQAEPPTVPRPWVECFKENKQTWAALTTESKPKT